MHAFMPTYIYACIHAFIHTYILMVEVWFSHILTKWKVLLLLLSRVTDTTSTLTCCFLFPGRTSILGFSFGAAFLSLTFILFVCFAGQLLVGASNIELLESVLIVLKWLTSVFQQQGDCWLIFEELWFLASFRLLGKRVSGINWSISETTNTLA